MLRIFEQRIVGLNCVVVILLCLAPLAFAQLFPSITKECDAAGSCTPQLQILGALPSQAQSNQVVSAQIPAGLVLDDGGTKYNFKAPLQIAFTSNLWFEFPLTFAQNVRNAYISAADSIQTNVCQNSNVFCCSTSTRQYTFGNNGTSFDLFSIAAGTQMGYLAADMSSGSALLGNLTVTPSAPEASLGPIKFQLIQNVATGVLFPLVGESYVTVERGVFLDGGAFIIPKSDLCTGTHCIGITSTAWREAVGPVAAGGCTDARVWDLLSPPLSPSTSPWDQLEGYRQSLLSRTFPYCSLLPTLSNTAAGSAEPNKLALRCTASMPASTFRLLLPVGEFSLQRVAVSITVASAGCVDRNQFYIDLVNTAKIGGDVVLTNTRCCAGSTCVSNAIPTQTLLVAAASTTRAVVDFVRDSDEPTTCYFSAQVGTDTPKAWKMDMSCSRPPLSCPPPKQKTLYQGYWVCRDSCPTEDMYLSPTSLECVPINCKAVYGETRGYFNSTSRLCEPNPAPELPNLPLPEDTFEYPQLECGNGNLVNGSCVCNQGWATQANSGAYCMQQVAPAVGDVVTITDTNASIAAVVLVVVCLIVAAIIAFKIYRKVKRDRNDKEKRRKSADDKESPLPETPQKEEDKHSDAGHSPGTTAVELDTFTPVKGNAPSVGAEETPQPPDGEGRYIGWTPKVLTYEAGEQDTAEYDDEAHFAAFSATAASEPDDA